MIENISRYIEAEMFSNNNDGIVDNKLMAIVKAVGERLFKL